MGSNHHQDISPSMGWLLALCGEGLPVLCQPIFKIYQWGRGLNLIKLTPEIFFGLYIFYLIPPSSDFRFSFARYNSWPRLFLFILKEMPICSGLKG